jgi:hypothetical protein
MKQEASTTDINHLRKEAPSKSMDLVGEVHINLAPLTENYQI